MNSDAKQARNLIHGRRRWITKRMRRKRGRGRRHEDERREFVVMFLNEFYMN
jgi:hypothetical protein